MSLTEAIAEDLRFRAATDAANEALRATLPEEPERGSYLWWVSVCRENTGQALCDSGIAYGYHYNAPYLSKDADPIFLHLYNGSLDYASIHLPHFLHTMYDAEDETATSLEKSLYEFAETMPRESWWDVVNEWLKIVEGYEIHDRGFNTYNHECDLDQVFQVDAILVDDYDDEYHVIRVHCGCDVRGGYASPVIAKPYDKDYVYDWLVDFYCQECHESWSMSYYYNEAAEKRDPIDIDGLAASLATYDAVANGQELLPAFVGLEDWSHAFRLGEARLLIAERDRQLAEHVGMYGTEDDFEFILPGAIVDDAIPDTDGYETVPAANARLLCPSCGTYNVHGYNSVYGF